MICVSINENTVESAISALKTIDFAEIRLDLINDLSFEGLERLIDVNKSIIITFRPSNIDVVLRIKYLSRAIELGVKYIDIEIETDKKIIKELTEKTKKSNTKIIISYHNFAKTPSLNDLIVIVNKSRAMGANLVKIATFINFSKDNVILMNLLGEVNDIIAIGMGKKGMVSRLSAVFLGSPFTYASLVKGKETADGQLDYKSMEQIFEILQQT